MIVNNENIDKRTLNNIIELKKRFEKIKDMEWIIGNIDNTGSAGIIFERLLGIEKNDFEVPDYDNIEIKTKNIKWLDRDISLFCAEPDNDLLESERIVEKYGKNNNKITDTKNFSICVNAVNCKTYDGKYYFKLYVDETKKQISLKIFDYNYNLIEDRISWSFDMLKQKLFRKLKYLILSYYESKKANGQIYFNYKKINFYKLNNFDIFIDLIKKGKIKINFKIYTYQGEYRHGKMYNHGTSFTIGIQNIQKLFERVLM